MKVQLPFKSIDATTNVVLTKEQVEAIIRWYFEQLHGTPIKAITYSHFANGIYDMKLTCLEKIIPISELNSKDIPSNENPNKTVTEIDINI